MRKYITTLSLIYISSFLPAQGVTQPGSSGIFINPQGKTQPFTPQTPSGPTTPAAPAGDKDRAVFWLYGLAGNSDSWSRAADATEHGGARLFPARGYKVVSHTTGLIYSEQSSTLFAADNVRNYLNLVANAQRRNNVDPKNNFIVAHSHGGVVCQALLYLDHCFDPNLRGPSYGGIVTFGAPHKGAMIYNNFGKIFNWVKDGCVALRQGPAEVFSNRFASSLLGLFTSTDRYPFIKGAESSICTRLENIAHNNLYTVPITDDFRIQEGGPLPKYKDCIEREAGEIAKVAFYGVEPTKNLPWRTLDWMLVSNVNRVPKFSANYDDSLSNIISKLRQNYVENVLISEQEIYRLERKYRIPHNRGRRIGDPLLYLLWDVKYWNLKDEIAAYKEGINWFDTADDKWADIIGALTLTRKTTYFCECVDTHSGKETTTEVNSPADCNPMPKPGVHCHLNIITEYEKSYKPSDGIVLAESASEFPGASTLPMGAPSRELTNSSHMQMLNDANTREKIKELCRGDYGDFFRTPER